MRRGLMAIASLLLVAGSARADDARARSPDEPDDKKAAQALVTRGIALLKIQRYDDALARFQAAYARYPSPKILLNIGTTYKNMGRLADAANTYQAYIADPETPADRLAEVKRILAGLDAQLVRLTIEITIVSAADGGSDGHRTQRAAGVAAEVSIDGRSWQPVAGPLVTRVSPGTRLVRARGPGFEPAEVAVDGSPGQRRSVSVVLHPVAAPPADDREPLAAMVPPGRPTLDEHDRDDPSALQRGAAPGLGAPPEHALARIDRRDAPALHAAGAPPAPERARGPGLVVQARIDGKLRGGAAAVGLVYAPVGSVEAEATALLADVYGIYLGARYRLLPGALSPHLAAGAPMFFSRGTRVAARVGAGVELSVTPHISLLAEVGYEHFFNPEPGYEADLFVPIVGVQGRL